MEQWLIDSVLGFGIGLVLGFLGGGGSILTVPALVYIVGQSPQAAVTASLIIVGANATMGAIFHRRQNTLNWPVALAFGGVGMVAAYFSAGLSHLLSPTTLLILFALLMLVVSALMILSKTPRAAGSKNFRAGTFVQALPLAYARMRAISDTRRRIICIDAHCVCLRA